MKKNITFFGMGLDSPNKGVNALCIGATEVIANSYDIKEIVLVSFRRPTKDKEYIIETSSGSVKVINKFYPKKELINALCDISLYKLFNKKPKSTLSELIYNSDLLFDLNEGDSFSDIYGKGRILRHFMDSFLAVSLNKNLTFLPQTIGPFNTFFGKKLGVYILKRLEKLYVRDDKAIALLNENNIDYIQTIDLAVYMKPKKIDMHIPENAIMINVNGLMYLDNYNSLKNQFTEYKNILLETVKYFQTLGKHIVFIPHTYNAIDPIEEDDLIAINDFVNTNNIKNVTIVDKDYDAQELKYIISHAELFIGSRMHSCIGGLSRSVPTVGLAYSYKFKGTFSMFGLEETVIEVNNLDNTKVITVVEKIKEIYNKKDEYKNILIENNKREILNIK